MYNLFYLIQTYTVVVLFHTKPMKSVLWEGLEEPTANTTRNLQNIDVSK